MSDVTRPFGSRGRLPEPPVVTTTASAATPFDSAPVMTSLLADGALVRGGEIEVEYTMMHGAGGTTYRAHERTSGRVLALKVLEGKYAHTVQAGVRLLAEAKYTALLHGHPNVVPVVDSGFLAEAHGRPYVATEFIDGTTLSTYAERVVPLELKLRLLRDVAAALADLHALGVVHRDVKPDNVLVTPASAGPLRARLTDFGYATTVAGGIAGGIAGVDAVAEHLTAEHERPGTKHYMAPEQCMGDAPTPAFDVYGLGITAYELLTGAAPMATASEREVVLRKCDPLQPGFSLARAGVRELPPSLVRLVDRALLFEPMLRQSAAEFRDGLDRVLLELGTAGAVDIADDGATAVVPRTHTEVVPRGHLPRPPAIVLAPEAIVRTGDTVVVETAGVPEPVVGMVKVPAVAARVGTSPVMLPVPDASDALPRAEVLARLAELEGAEVSQRAHGEPVAAPRRWPWAVLGLAALAGVAWLAWPTPGENAAVNDTRSSAVVPSEAVIDRAIPPAAPSASTAAPMPAAPQPPTPAPSTAPPVAAPDVDVGPKPKARPRTAAPPVSAGPRHATQECALEREAATRAWDANDWSAVVKHTARRACWADATARLRLRLRALVSVGNYSECAAEGRNTADAKLLRIVEGCRQQMESR